MNPNDNWLSETNSPKAGIAILFGSIDDLTIDHCLSLYPKGLLVVCEESLPIREQIQSISAKTNIHDFLKVLSEFLLIDPVNRPEVKISSSIPKEEFRTYEKLANHTLNQIDTTQRARKTRKETGFIRQMQVFSNLPGYLLSRLPEEWKGIGQGKVAVVVGAGPSLDITLELISKITPAPIIIATDSSLRALKMSQVDPDFVISIDPEKTFDSCSYQDFTPGILIISSQAHPSWSEKWNGKSRYISGRVLFEDWLSEKGISKTSLHAINNAGLTALAMADFLDPAVIILVGMDMSGKGDGSTRYAKLTGRDHIQTLSQIYHEIPGNFCESVKTPFLSDWQETSEFCKKISAKRTVINLNDDGAFLAGTNPIHPNEFPELVNLLAANIKSSERFPLSLTDQKRTIHEVGKVQVLTLLAKKCDEVWEKLEKEDISSEKIVKEIFQNQDLSTMLGDFSFSIMPSLVSGDKSLCHESIIRELKNIIWKLEDAILASSPPETFLIKFLSEKFH